MTTAKRNRAAQPKDDRYGLLANGSSGPWDICIDEHLSEERWRAQVEGPVATFAFDIPSLDIVAEMSRFLDPAARSGDRSSALVLSAADASVPVTLVRDDEYDDRFFVIVGSTSKPVVHFVIAGSDIGNIAGALRQVADDIDAES